MEKEAHIKRHKELHKAFDELLADFILHIEKFSLEISIMELMQWSHQQTINPTIKEE